MTRKDYQLLADHIANGVRFNHIDRVGVDEIADALQSDNWRFDRGRFYTACGIED